jgi:lipopolysaccharide transport system ATP-binding protein
MKPIIRVKNLSKCYQIGRLDSGYTTFREVFAGTMAVPFRRLRGRRSSSREEIWALKDINFEVQPNEIVGLIGHNGVGKSTLLKVISRITVPTTGRTEVYGRIGSLLEVGTGFHPDLTGRENVFLSGTLLGIRRAEISRKFDEIVAFSEIEKFIDTPVKRYSSGMYLRLAFSVAAHLDTEVLIMDEVLAVGDISFQQKCLDKMHEIRQQGRTILFVSHNMAAVTRLCKRVILLEQGRMVSDGPAQRVVNDYLGTSLKVTSMREWRRDDKASGNEIVCLRQVRVCNEEGATTDSVDIQKPVGIEIVYEVLQPGHFLSPKIDLFNEGGVHLFAAHDMGPDRRSIPRPVGSHVSTAWIPGNLLSAGNLLVHVSLVSHAPATVLHVNAPNAVGFHIAESTGENSSRSAYPGHSSGLISPLLNWTNHLLKEKPVDCSTDGRPTLSINN